MYRYDEKFYKYIEQTKNDEKTIMPLIMQWISPKSIIDFGCAEGAWLGEALLHDNEIDVLGMDGDYINRKKLKIPENDFMAVDLRQRISLERRFDLAISTEVAEHLEEKFADVFIDNITRASDQVLFSAAIPGQHGENHVNEQWQSYWMRKFEKRGYYCDYSVRNYFWNDPKISSWRRQNLLFFSKKKVNIAPERQMIDVVHPEEAVIKRSILEWNLKVAEYYLLHSEILFGIEMAIKKNIEKKETIVIYPYGNNGRLCEKILSEKYKVSDYILADNKVQNHYKKIFTAKQLRELENGFIVIDTCSNSKIHKEILKEILRYVNADKIYSAFNVEGC